MGIDSRSLLGSQKRKCSAGDVTTGRRTMPASNTLDNHGVGRRDVNEYTLQKRSKPRPKPHADAGANTPERSEKNGGRTTSRRNSRVAARQISFAVIDAYEKWLQSCGNNTNSYLTADGTHDQVGWQRVSRSL